MKAYRHSRKTKEAAAKLLSAVACGSSWSWDQMALAVDGDDKAILLAHDVVNSINDDAYEHWQELWAEAEARLRNGEYP